MLMPQRKTRVWLYRTVFGFGLFYILLSGYDFVTYRIPVSPQYQEAADARSVSDDTTTSDTESKEDTAASKIYKTTKLQEESEKKTILMWYKSLSGHLPEGYVRPFCEARYRNCYMTFNRSLLAVSDAVVFSVLDLSLDDLPPYHTPNQPWVLYESEPPRNKDLAPFSSVIDATYTYRMDSDILKPYGLYTEWNKEDRNPYDPRKNYAAEHDKLVAWLVSHCHAKSRRDQYARELGKHIRVDVYGRCGPLSCGSRQICSDTVGHYKFYLAFENMLCDQYITEKLWHVLYRTDKLIVPIVMGGSNYSQLLPPHSFIDIRDFKSPQKLAEYLRYLNSNDEAYNAYFKWRLKYRVRLLDVDCELCAFVNNKNSVTLKKRNLHKWWTDGRCVSPHAYFRGVADELTNLPPLTGICIAEGREMPLHD